MGASPARHVTTNGSAQVTRRRTSPGLLELSDGEAPMGQALLDDAELWELSGGDGLAKMHPGTLLVSEGDPVESVFLIQSGQVEVYRRARGRRLVVQILRPGDLLGLVPHLCGRPAHYNARAISSVQVVRLRPEAITWLLQTRPALSKRLLVYLAVHLERMARRVEELTEGGLRAQVAAVLLDQTEDRSGFIRLPQSTLADLLGASRSSVNRILKEMETEGMIRVHYRRVEVLDVVALRRVIR